MNSLFAKLSIALLLIVGLMGTAFYVVDRHNTRLYYEELTQTLNAPIAMYVTGEKQLIERQVVDLESLQELAARAMVVNPTAEIYLLDAGGEIVGHAFPPESILRTNVDLKPIQSLLAGDAVMPVHGDDPRSLSMRKVFSAAEIQSESGLEGYLYVVLGGQTYEGLANAIGQSYVGRVSFFGALVIVFAAATIGLLVFGLLTRRLKILSNEMRRVSRSGFDLEPALLESSANGDEIDQLAHAFVHMSARIREQLRQLKENDHLRRELVTNISHDLRTPLAAMQGALETMCRS